MESRHKARELAFKALYSWELNKTTTFADIANIEREFDSIETISDFGEKIFDGVINNLEEVDHRLVEKLKNWDLERLEKADLSILRLSVYSLLKLREISKVVTINEAINLSKEFGSDSSYKFINGVLDSIVVDCEVKSLK